MAHVCTLVHTRTHTHTHTDYPQNFSEVLSFNNLRSISASNFKKYHFKAIKVLLDLDLDL